MKKEEKNMEQNLAERVAQLLYDKKALDITVLHVGQMTVITDYMVIASGRSALQVRALADDVDDKMAEWGVALRRKEGTAEGRWAVLDYGTVLVHLFHPEEREYYRLEKLWDDGQNRLPLPFEQDGQA
ncbi:MAG: ribosome silencing factor [Clostridiales bacterium]|nr:ribosome silencing factor [Clostridiales bacterium]